MPLAHILGEMESIGVQVDVDRLKKMGEELSAKLAGKHLLIRRRQQCAIYCINTDIASCGVI